MRHTEETEGFMNADEAAMFLKLSKSTIYKMVSTGRITFRKHGSRVCFFKQDLIDYSNRRKFEEDLDVASNRPPPEVLHKGSLKNRKARRAMRKE